MVEIGGVGIDSRISKGGIMKKRNLALAGVVMIVAVMAALVWTGCESAGGTDGISLSPSNPTLGAGSSNATSAVVFTAAVRDQLALPLKWSVSDPGLGGLISASGSNATYMATAGRTGNNVITVRDQYDNKGSAVVTQQ